MLVKSPWDVYFSGGATAVMLGLRKTTIDVDIYFEPDEMQMYKAIQMLKEKLNMNIELASPFDFIPPLPYWKERSIFVTEVKKARFFHLDLYSKIIAKVQRGWEQDVEDVRGFLKTGIDKLKMKQLFSHIKPGFIKFPSVNVNILEKKLNDFLNGK